ncbi:hypothetical protein VNO77_29042 [Canavalia gladiata]|uniref:Uncharacterized protein n=1 Tax=Canavalia gladiata TaxID=3824 RepID=A0AAN9QBG9_CANGL
MKLTYRLHSAQESDQITQKSRLNYRCCPSNHLSELVIAVSKSLSSIILQIIKSSTQSYSHHNHPSQSLSLNAISILTHKYQYFYFSFAFPFPFHSLGSLLPSRFRSLLTLCNILKLPEFKMENGDQFQEISKAKYDCLLFDLDDTLYPLSSGLAEHVKKNIQEYMLQKLGIEEAKVPELCFSLYKTYGTTMAGLKAIGYDFDYDDFHGFVHGRLPYNILKPDLVLRGILLSQPVRKIVFTNSDEAHASRVLGRLGLEDCFERVISFETLNSSNNLNTHENEYKPSSTGIFDFYEYSRGPDSNIVLPKTPVVCKPFQDAFEKVFNIADIDPQRTLFFDDSVRNLQTGKSLGLHTVLVGTSVRTTGVDHALESIHNMKEAFPELWEADEKPESVDCSRKVSIETSVIA